MRRKSHLLLVFGGIVFLIYYKWQSSPGEHELVAESINMDVGSPMVGEQTDDFDNPAYYQAVDNDTSVDFNMGAAEDAGLALDHIQEGAQELGANIGQGGEEELHLDIVQDQAGAPQPPALPQQPVDGLEQQNVEQQAPIDQQQFVQEQQPQQVPQSLGQLDGQLQAGQQLEAGQLQAVQQLVQDVQPAMQQFEQNAQPELPVQQQQLPV